MRHGFWAAAQERPLAVAVIEGNGRRTTAGDLLARCNRLVHGLRRLGLPPGAVVAAALGHRVEQLEILLAALQAGWYFLPLDPDLPLAALEAILQEVAPDVLVGLGEGPSTFDEQRHFVLETDSPEWSWRRLWEEESAALPDDRRAGERLLLTSGTTGRPRAVRRPLSGLSPEHLGRQAALHLKAVCGIAPGSGQVHLVASPLHHSASLLWCGDQLQLGHTVVLMPVKPWRAEVALAAIAEHRVTSTLMVPTHFRRLLDVREGAAFDVGSLRYVVHTGAPCSVALKQSMLDWWGPVIYEVYGAAEGAGTRVSPEEWRDRPGTVGQSHGRVRVVRPDGTPCGPGEVGRVLLKTSGGFSSVGDLGYLDDEDYLYLAGREDDVIVSGGVNVHPLQVEEVLLSHQGVLDAAVMGVPDPEWGQRLTALVQPAPGADADLLDSLQALCRSKLPVSHRPRDYMFVEALPRDSQGKLRRRDLVQPNSPEGNSGEL